ncbi:YggS family pyridoxal phosphate-dependent enzyme [Pseudohaliea sp.]|uniref:YggS family pyridoxal phosphate-dependent enzyme n=1 Tax=Pseudohaliea sp. TaxID=2740289 RepID=UPI0032ECCA7F
MDADCIAGNIAEVWERVRAAAEKVGRDPKTVQVLAVSKTHPAEAVRAAFAAGQRHFGENYLQEAEDKIAATGDLDIHWHFIGPIQSNKTRSIAAHFDWVHSLDRLKIARRLSEQRPDNLPPLKVCLQVNISGEASKSGVEPDALPALAAAVAALPRLELRGLMAIPAPVQDEARKREPFARLAALLATLGGTLPGLDTLSMGMSADLEAAIAEGATLVRIGTAIFGPRGT